MKKHWSTVAVVVIGLAAVGVTWRFVSHQTAVVAAMAKKPVVPAVQIIIPARPTTAPAREKAVPPQRVVVPISKAFKVQAGYEETLRFSFPADKTPGTLQGYWSAEGKSAQLAGAADDTLTGFNLLGPNNETLQQIKSPASGNFSIRYEGGIYTFQFQNSGFLRSSPRIVKLTATYQPD